MTGEGRPNEGESSERIEGFGPIDPTALRRFRDLVLDLEPLVESAALDDPVNPQTLAIELTDGVGTATGARLDIRWSLSGNYAVHYSDEAGRNFRFDHHPKPDAPRRHFHPPPDAPSRPVEPSCVAVTELQLVARAVHQRWRYAYENGTFEEINAAEDPP